MATPVAKTDAPCPQCGAPGGDPLWAGREHEYDNTTEEVFRFVRCTSCGLVRLNPRPDVSELSRIYPPNYYAYNLLSGQADGKLGFTDRSKQRMYQRRLVTLVDRLGKRGTIRILDVGCADGRLLDWYAASPVGSRLETHGIEMSEAAAERARRRGHRVVSGRFEVDRARAGGIRSDPRRARHRARRRSDRLRATRCRAARSDGLFVVATPNWDSVDARRLRGHWGGNHFPRHWTLYDERTARRLAESVGLALERVEYQPNPIFWVWSCHSWLRSRFPDRRWVDRLFPPVGIFSPSLQSFLLLSTFTLLEALLGA